MGKAREDGGSGRADEPRERPAKSGIADMPQRSKGSHTDGKMQTGRMADSIQERFASHEVRRRRQEARLEAKKASS